MSEGKCIPRNRLPVVFIALGIVLGAVYFFIFERPNKDDVSMECWQKLHYMSKQRSSLAMVHAKSILTGVLIIYAFYQDWWWMIMMLSAAIVGLHISQAYVEFKYIRDQNGKNLQSLPHTDLTSNQVKQ